MNNQFATQFLLQEDHYDPLEQHLLELGCDEEACKYLMIAVRKGLLHPSEAIKIVQSTVPGVEETSTTGGGVTGGPTAASWDPQGPTGTGEQMATTKAFKKKKYQEDSSEDEESLEVGDRVKVVYGNQFYGHTGTIEDIIRGFVIVDIDGKGTYSMHSSDVEKIEDEEDFEDEEDLDEDAPRLAGSPAKTTKQGAKNLSAYSSVGFTKAPNAEEAGKKIKGVEVDMLWKEALGESRAYLKFKKEAATRSKDQQMHEAVRMIHSRLTEVGKLLEYAQQMRAELSEGEQALEYNHNTKKMFERINSKVVEIYSKTRQLK